MPQLSLDRKHRRICNNEKQVVRGQGIGQICPHYQGVTKIPPIYLPAIDQSHATLASVMYNLNSNRSKSGPFSSRPAFNLPVAWFSGIENGSLRGLRHCPICDSFLSGSYYRVNGQTACAVCAIQARARKTSKFMLVRRALLALGTAMMCFALPFLRWQHPIQDSVGLCVLVLVARIAWQFDASRRLNLDGPYKAS